MAYYSEYVRMLGGSRKEWASVRERFHCPEQRGTTAKELERAVGMEATSRKRSLEIVRSLTERWDDAGRRGQGKSQAHGEANRKNCQSEEEMRVIAGERLESG